MMSSRAGVLIAAVNLPRTKSPSAFVTKLVRALSSSAASPPSSPTSQWAAPSPEDEDVHPADLVFAAGVRHHHTANTAYPIAHAKTFRLYRVPRLKDQDELRGAISAAYSHLDEMMLYAHVPFCAQRCQFCEYTVVDPTLGKHDSVQDGYFRALMGEFDLYRDLLSAGIGKKKIVGFDIGGGTPSMASVGNIERVMDRASNCFDFDPSHTDVSIETTPRIAAAEPDKIKAYYDMGIRRISMGVQTTDFALAKRLGRDDGDYLASAVDNIRAAGFRSFNVDLMYGFPLREGAEDKWGKTIASTIELLSPDHITLYRMRYKGTKMAHLQERVGLRQINRQSDEAARILTDAGYEGWVGKNTFSRIPGDSGCSDYLEKRVVKGVPYCGLGLGAQSFSHSTLAYNLGGVTKRMHQYVKSVELGRLPVQDLYHLSTSGAWAKFCSVSFYFGGIDLASFESNFGLSLEEAYPDKVAFAIDNGLMELQDSGRGRRLQMTPLGKAHYGGVLALFYAPHVQRHLMELPGGEVNATGYMEMLGRGGTGGGDAVPPAAVADPKRPYVGNPMPRYERRRMKRQDPRASLPADWAEGAALAAAPTSTRPMTKTSNPVRREFSTSARAQQQQKSKTRAEEPGYNFGNILFGGPCNQRCVFCIGRQLPEELSPRNLRDWPLKNLDLFVDLMKQSKTKRIILTGTTTDPQLYKHEGRLLDHLRGSIPEAHISIHTNGLLALRKVDTFNRYDTATISVNSFVPETFAKIHGVTTMPDVASIVAYTDPRVKLSCVLTEDNVGEVERYLGTAAEMGVKRVAVRHVFDVPTATANGTGGGSRQRTPSTPELFERLSPVRFHCNNPVFDIDGVEVTYWTFDKTSGRSLNLFANGLLSDEYLLSKAPGVEGCAPTCSASASSVSSV